MKCARHQMSTFSFIHIRQQILKWSHINCAQINWRQSESRLQVSEFSTVTVIVCFFCKKHTPTSETKIHTCAFLMGVQMSVQKVTKNPITYFQFQVHSKRAVTSSSQGVLSLLSSELWSVMVDRIRLISSVKRAFKSCRGKHFVFIIWTIPIGLRTFADNGSLVL